MKADHDCIKEVEIAKLEERVTSNGRMLDEIRADVKRMMLAIAVVAGASGGITGAIMNILSK